MSRRRVRLRSPTPDDLSQIEAWYIEAPGEGERLVISRKGDPAPIGMIHYRLGVPAQGWAAIEFIALAPRCRGWGYGSEAVRLFEERLADAGVPRLLAGVDAGNGLGLYFWLRLGYRPARPDEIFCPSAGQAGIISMVRSRSEA